MEIGRAHNPKVVGSNPTPATNDRPVLIGGFFVYGGKGREPSLSRSPDGIGPETGEIGFSR